MANKKTPGVAKKKVNWKIYLRNTWQLYVMMLIPIIWLICFSVQIPLVDDCKLVQLPFCRRWRLHCFIHEDL